MVILLGLGGYLSWRVFSPSETDSGSAAPAPDPIAAAQSPAAPTAPSPSPDASDRPPRTDRDEPEDDAAPDDVGGGFERALRWSQVDLEALRREMPDNLYWEMGAPTDDPRLIEERARERARWNEAWGRVLAGQASEQEIEDYFAHRQRLSTDYIAFASTLLERHGEVLPERDAAMLELVVSMHHKRLQELPRTMAEALERQQEQEALREAWLRDEARFAAPDDDAD